MKDALLAERCRKIKLILTDVDGVMTDGRVLLMHDGREAQAFDGGTRLRESGHEGGLERGRRLPGVAPDDVAVGSDDLGHGSAEAAGEILGQLRSVTATQAIGAEPHGWLSAWCTAEPYEPS